MNKGFTLIFAIVVVNAVLAVAIGVASIITGFLVVQQAAEGSAEALFAADSGAECALYGDFAVDAFSTSSPDSYTCANQTIVGDADGVTTFQLVFSSSCVGVEVIKEYQGGRLETTIVSQGQDNIDCAQAPRGVVQRGLRIEY